MNHSETIQLQAAVKYVLGELSPADHAAYEEHYFDCPECAADLKALAAFADNAREVLRQQQHEQLVAARVPAPSIWSRFFHPIIAVPAFAALLLIIVFQNTVSIPNARLAASSPTAQLFVTSRVPKMAVTRAEEDLPKYSVRAGESLPLKFDFTPIPSADSYLCQLQDASGRTLLQLPVPGSFTNKELNLVLPANLVHAGKYALLFTSAPPANSQVLRLSFTVELLS